MLAFDQVGRLIPPGQTVKTWGGDFDERGIPADCSIPATGDYLNVSTTDDGIEAVYINRPDNTPGLARVQGPEIVIGSDLRALKLQASVIGGGSGITSGQSQRDFSLGFLSDDGQDGAVLKNVCAYSAGTAAHNFRAYNGGVETVSDDLNVTISGYATRYNIDIWLSLCPNGQWQISYGENGLVHKQWRFTTAEVGMTTLRPVVAWDWVYPTGSFSPRIRQMTGEIHYF